MYRGLRVLRRWLRVASLPMPGAEHDARGAALVCEVAVQGPDYAAESIRQICQSIAKYPSNFPKSQSKFRTRSRAPARCRTRAARGRRRGAAVAPGRRPSVSSAQPLLSREAPTPDAKGGGCAYLVHVHAPAHGLRRAVGGVQQLLPEHRLHHAEHRRVRRHVVPRGG